MARLADNFAFKEGWSEYYTVYQGAWELYQRDIDPSHDLSLVERSFEGKKWWRSNRYDKWQKTISNQQWIANENATQLTNKFLIVKDDKGDEWISLESYYKWREPQKPGKRNRYSGAEREVWLLQRAYIVRDSQAKELYDWAKGKNYIGGWLQEPNDFHKIFLREFPDATAYKNEYEHNNKKIRWRKMRDEKRKSSKFEVLSTCEQYMNEATTFDCSVKDTVHVYMPAREVVKGMKIRRSTTNSGEFVDITGKVIAQDPSVNSGDENCLLIRKKEFLEFLKKRRYSLVWAVMGEKIILSMAGGHGRLEFGGTYLMDNNGKIKGRKYKKLQKPRK